MGQNETLYLYRMPLASIRDFIITLFELNSYKIYYLFSKIYFVFKIILQKNLVIPI